MLSLVVVLSVYYITSPEQPKNGGELAEQKQTNPAADESAKDKSAKNHNVEVITKSAGMKLSKLCVWKFKMNAANCGKS